MNQPLRHAIKSLAAEHGISATLEAVRSVHDVEWGSASKGQANHSQHLTTQTLLVRAVHHCKLAEGLR